MVTENNFKFLAPPTIEQIDKVIKDAGVSQAQFERFHNIYENCIAQVRMGYRELPSQYWHLFLTPQKALSAPLSRKARQSIPQTNSKGRITKGSVASKLL